MGIKLKKTKKTKNTKKGAMALVLLLVILTSFAFIIAGSMKLLSVSDKYSINRFADGGAGANKVSGAFLCYKKKSESGEYKLYEQRADNKPDGSRVISEEKEVSQCEFEIPQGVKKFTITLVGSGGSGAISSAQHRYKETICEMSSNNETCGPESGIIRSLDNSDNCTKTGFTVYEPYIEVQVGSEGEPGEVIKFETDNMNGPDGNRDKITINKKDISDPEQKNSVGNILPTKFEYFYQDSKKGYQLKTETANAGENGGIQTQELFVVSNINARSGKLPDSTKFTIPSWSDFIGATAGKFLNDEPIDATYVGASGASQEIKFKELDSNFVSICKHYDLKYKDGKDDCASDYNPNKDDCNELYDSNIRNYKFSNGAPGAILIKW